MGIVCVVVFLVGILGAFYCMVVGEGIWSGLGGTPIPEDLKCEYIKWWLILAASVVPMMWAANFAYFISKKKNKVDPSEGFKDAWLNMGLVFLVLWGLSWITVRFGPAGLVGLVLFGPMLYRAFRNPSKARKDAIDALKALGYNADKATSLAERAKGNTAEEIVKDAVRLDHLTPHLN